MKITQNQVNRVTHDYTVIAKEPVQVEFITGAMFVYGSELACLRLHLKMPGRVAFSTNLDTWFYTRDMKF